MSNVAVKNVLHAKINPNFGELGTLIYATDELETVLEVLA